MDKQNKSKTGEGNAPSDSAAAERDELLAALRSCALSWINNERAREGLNAIVNYTRDQIAKAEGRVK